jgi:nicotinamidase-related amidase
VSLQIVAILLSTIAKYNGKANRSICLLGGNVMQKKALAIIDIQNDITNNYKDIIDNVNKAIDWAFTHEVHVVYIRHENLSVGTRTFKPDTRGSELAPDLKIVSENIFTKYKGNALSSEGFADFISKNEIGDFYIAGADAVACVKSTCYNLRKAQYGVTVLSDCVTSYDKRKIDAMLRHYERQGCEIMASETLALSSNPKLF